MTSSIIEEYWKIILKSNNYFSYILFELEKICIFENCILGQKDVHLVLNIRFRQ